MKISLQEQKRVAYEKGSLAFYNGVELHKNPYQYFSAKQNGILLSCYWEKGYIEASARVA